MLKLDTGIHSALKRVLLWRITASSLELFPLKLCLLIFIFTEAWGLVIDFIFVLFEIIGFVNSL